MSLSADQFVGPALERGYSFWTGVPCSFLTPFINFVISDPRLEYVGAASEGEAVGIAAGAHMAGRKTVVICQNSGLGNTVNPLASLNHPFRIPTLLIVTHRGAPGLKDEPQHEVMGRVTGALLDVLGIPWEPFPAEAGAVAAVLRRAEASMAATGLPYGLVMAKGAVADCALKARRRPRPAAAARPAGALQPAKGWLLKRLEAIRAARAALSGHALVATTGHIGRELFSLGHSPNHFYVVGSMGCASGIGLGVHQGLRGRRWVTVLDGDGAALMKLGTLATIGHYAPKRFLHLVLDNEAHESTGGQATVSPTVDLAAVAAACGYRGAWRVQTAPALTAALRAALRRSGPHLIHVKVARGTDPGLGRPTLTPPQVKEQFMAWLAR